MLEAHLAWMLESLFQLGGKPAKHNGNVTKYLRRSSNTRKPAARAQNRTTFSKDNMIETFGFTPTPAHMLDVYQQCVSRANHYLSRMNEAFRAGTYAQKVFDNYKEGVHAGNDTDDFKFLLLQLEALASISAKELTKLQAYLAVALSCAMGGCRLSFLRQCQASWFAISSDGKKCYFDPSADKHLFKTGEWNHTSSRKQIPVKLGKLVLKFMQLVPDKLKPSGIRCFFTVHVQNYDCFKRKFHLGCIHDIKCRRPGKTFLRACLKSVLIGDDDDEGFGFKAINQKMWRHLVAWMTYEVWHQQLPHDLVGMASRYKHSPTRVVTFNDMCAMASADANNTPEVWQSTYAPHNMSVLTAEQEDEAAAGAVSERSDVSDFGGDADYDNIDDGDDDNDDNDRAGPSCARTPRRKRSRRRQPSRGGRGRRQPPRRATPAITIDTLLAEQRRKMEAQKEHEARLRRMDEYDRMVWGSDEQTEEEEESSDDNGYRRRGKGKKRRRNETEEEEESSDDNGYSRRGKGKKRRRNGKGPATKRSMPWFHRAV